MEAEEILRQARASTEAPYGWIVLPLLRNKVVVGMVGWAFGILVGLGMFALIAPIVIPHNYEHGVVAALFTTLVLGVFLFISIGSAWSLIVDAGRLRNADQYLIVITPEDFVKQEKQKVTHVPLTCVQHITARGVPPPERTAAPGENTVRDIPGVGENVTSFFLGRGLVPSGQRWLRRRRRAPTSLAFIDTRTDEEVIVVTDGSFGDPFMIAAQLKRYVASVHEFVL
jgi:hypothetical protein